MHGRRIVAITVVGAVAIAVAVHTKEARLLPLCPGRRREREVICRRGRAHRPRSLCRARPVLLVVVVLVAVVLWMEPVWLALLFAHLSEAD